MIRTLVLFSKRKKTCYALNNLMLQSKLKVHKLKLVERTHSYRLILPSAHCFVRHSSLKRLKAH